MIANILLEDMRIYAYHGCYKEEQEVGNWFVVNVSLDVDTTLAAKSDDIKDALNYVAVFNVVKEEMAVKSHLLENVVDRICKKIKENFSSCGLVGGKVKVAKMAPPVGGEMKCVSLIMSI